MEDGGILLTIVASSKRTHDSYTNPSRYNTHKMQRSSLFLFGRKDSTKEGGQSETHCDQRPEFQKSAKRSIAISLCAGQTVSTVAPEMDAQHTDHYNQQWDGGIW
jgi:hypothetical protein